MKVENITEKVQASSKFKDRVRKLPDAKSLQKQWPGGENKDAKGGRKKKNKAIKHDFANKQDTAYSMILQDLHLR